MQTLRHCRNAPGEVLLLGLTAECAPNSRIVLSAVCGHRIQHSQLLLMHQEERLCLRHWNASRQQYPADT